MKKMNRAGLFLLGCLLMGCAPKSQEIIWESADQKSEISRLQEAGEKEEMEAGDSAGSEVETEVQICVDISGAVQVPGVYHLREGDRVYQAVEMAGGLLENADRDSINQAAVLKDGEKIRIYTQEEAADLAESEKAAGLVNLNTADVDALCTLTGIGESRAQDIIAYREAHGSFQSVEEIMNVSGIKETTFQKIKDKIVVE